MSLGPGVNLRERGSRPSRVDSAAVAVVFWRLVEE